MSSDKKMATVSTANDKKFQWADTTKMLSILSLHFIVHCVFKYKINLVKLVTPLFPPQRESSKTPSSPTTCTFRTTALPLPPVSASESGRSLRSRRRKCARMRTLSTIASGRCVLKSETWTISELRKSGKRGCPVSVSDWLEIEIEIVAVGHISVYTVAHRPSKYHCSGGWVFFCF